MEKEFEFTEKQKFTQWWIWVILLGINGIFFSGLIKQLIFGQKFGNNPMSNAGLVLFALGFLAFTILFFVMGLYTKIDNHGIYSRFIPFDTAFKFYPWEKITSIQICKYKALKEYGGWGIRGGRNGMAYTVTGNKGFVIELSNNKKILIGTRKPEEVMQVLQKLAPSSIHLD